ncbi:HAD-superfamily hydrolase [Klebsormidium nitens]|uniref:HAD-superfamily hydrolase n=1 Tax=Klebsormidium nitens TaxID=105231 RepID=A0A1Y1I7P3_KLENI|nr:HAD-superfamily hydrolase [Klebsormidium nitens]|eukprot:GAQ85962.1 HAD-superfamily hydrolase [Klebsormidium nitens]
MQSLVNAHPVGFPARALSWTSLRGASGQARILAMGTVEPTPGDRIQQGLKPDAREDLSANRPSPPPLPKGIKLKAVFFDVDGTIAVSDPLHFKSFQEMLSNVGFNGGIPIDEAFFQKNISGRHNPDIAKDLFPDWPMDKAMQFMDDKEAHFRKLALGILEPTGGLLRFCKWVEEKGLTRAAVTNAPRANAEQMIKAVGLEQFFQLLVIGSECKRGKPHPDPYEDALKHFGLQPNEAVVIEDSSAGLQAAVAAGIPSVGILTGNPESSLIAAGASVTIRDFDDEKLWKALEQ